MGAKRHVRAWLRFIVDTFNLAWRVAVAVIGGLGAISFIVEHSIKTGPKGHKKPFVFFQPFKVWLILFGASMVVSAFWLMGRFALEKYGDEPDSLEPPRPQVTPAPAAPAAPTAPPAAAADPGTRPTQTLPALTKPRGTNGDSFPRIESAEDSMGNKAVRIPKNIWIAADNPQVLRPGQQVTFKIEATDPNGEDIYMWSLSGGPKTAKRDDQRIHTGLHDLN